MLTSGYAPSSINIDLYTFQATLRFLQGRGLVVPQALLKVAGLKVPDSLPRFLTDAQIGQLRHDLEQRVKIASTAAQRRNALLDRAAFYLLWQAGLRVGELEELSLADLNLGQQRLMIRQGKGLKDRTTYLTTSTITAVKAFLTVRGTERSDHLFLYRRRPLCKDLIRDRMKAAGKRTGIKVTPHMLRHTFATQLLNAGCKVTTIQALLGHKRLNSTMVYARVHDQTVANDYFTAMSVIEEQMYLQLAAEANPERGIDSRNKNNNSPADLLTLTTSLQTEPLTESQQAVVDKLQYGLLALAESMNGNPIQTDQVVNEQVMQMHTRGE
jgi:site-specific recombinase XerD